MIPVPLQEADELVALGAFAGAQVLVVCFSVIVGNVYRERALMLHAATALLGVLALQGLIGAQPLWPESVLLLVLAGSALHLRDLVSHAGAMERARFALVALGAGGLPALAVGAGFLPQLLAAGFVAWAAVLLFTLARAWPQSQPWVRWLLPAYAALGGAVGLAAAERVADAPSLLWVAGLLSVWSACIFLGTVWRGRLQADNRVRIDARTTVDPLTGLVTPLVLGERVHAARNQIRRYGHPSVLLLVHIENLPRIAEEFGPEAAEAAIMAAANRVRQSLREGDVAARVAHSRIAVLAEGLSAAEGAAHVASRILVAGLKEPLAAAPAEFLQFRVVMCAIPSETVPARALLLRLGARLDAELAAPTERRIVTLTGAELIAG